MEKPDKICTFATNSLFGASRGVANSYTTDTCFSCGNMNDESQKRVYYLAEALSGPAMNFPTLKLTRVSVQQV